MDIIRLPDDQKVTRNGIYEITLQRHHSGDLCDGPSVSSTNLRTLDLQSPLHAWNRWSGNPDCEKDDPAEIESEHFRLGRAAHTLLLEPDLYAKNFSVRPAEFSDWRSKLSKEWRTAEQEAGRTVLTPDDKERVDGMVGALRAHKWHTEGILGGVVEASLVCRDRKTGLWLKSRPDSIPLTNAFTDLKTTTDASPRAVTRSIGSLGYDLQLALGGACWEIITGERIEQFWLVFVENRRPYAIHVEALSLDAIYWARIRLRKALDTWRKCLDEGFWPSYGLDGQEFSPSHWEVERYKAEQSSGLLPVEDNF